MRILNRTPVVIIRNPGNPTWDRRPMTAAERAAAYEEEDREREAEEQHREWAREQQDRMLRRRNVTDRALRYRANANPPDGPEICCYCGSERFVEVDHVNGFEDDTEPENLVWACRSCNTSKGFALKNARMGRRTAQYNPTKSGGAANLGEWMQAVGAIVPHVDRGDRGLSSEMSTSAAVAMIRATPQHRRSEFAAQLRKHGRGRRRRDEVPF